VNGLTGRVAVVTGAGRGLGRLISGRLGQEGASVAMLSRSEGPLREAEELARRDGHHVLALPVDVGSRTAVEDAFARIADELGPAAVLVNNAQSWGDPDDPPLNVPYTPLELISDAEWEHTFRTGFGGTLNCMRAALPGMREARWGRVVNLYSPATARSSAGFAAYNCAKDAILSLTRTAAREWGTHGITVNCLAPLVIDDGMRDRMGEIPEEMREQAEAATRAMFAVFDTADPARDVAAAAAFLASDEASFITGEVVRVDGGYGL
jgi:NAD(P)-dependent dehydrogenase (short-subunit alcohol dehydrogenase family)